MNKQRVIEERMEQGYFRYEMLRRLNVHQFGVIYERNILLGVRFDYMIDQLRDLTSLGQNDLFKEWEREIHFAKCRSVALSDLTRQMDAEGVYDRRLDDPTV